MACDVHQRRTAISLTSKFGLSQIRLYVYSPFPCCSVFCWTLGALLATRCPGGFEGTYCRGGGRLVTKRALREEEGPSRHRGTELRGGCGPVRTETIRHRGAMWPRKRRTRSRAPSGREIASSYVHSSIAAMIA